MINIRENSKEYRNWKKEQNLRREYKKGLKRRKKKKNKKKYCFGGQEYTKEFKVPNDFSILENSEVVVKFFSEIISYIKKINRNKRKIEKYDILIDMSNTENITGDALMYLLTIIMNIRINKKNITIHWHGNAAKTDDANLFIKSCGFLNYLNTDKKNILVNRENIQIKSGKFIEPNIKREICDFTNEKLGTNIKYSSFLHNTLNELMLNTRDHAYNEISNFKYNWYVFVENDNDRIKYTFIDNGLGIPTTVKKKFYEIVLNNLYLDKEYKYVESALNGEFKRSQTGQSNRGKGLPEIFKYENENKISNLTIISNYAYYNKQKSFDLNSSLEGTLIYWEILKNKKEGYISD